MNRIKNLFEAFFLLFILTGLTSPIYAQVGIRSIGLDVGWYQPSLDFWNEVSATSVWADKFSGDLYGRINVEVRLAKPVSARIGFGYWKQTLEQPDIPFGSATRKDILSLQFLPLTLDFLGYPSFEAISPVQPYGGIGFGINFVSMKYTREISTLGSLEDNNSGRDFIAYLLVGFEIPVYSAFSTGVEFRYVIGQYIQQTSEASGVSDNEVSVTGPQVTLSLKYLFAN